MVLTWYFPLALRSIPSLSQVTIGLGFPKAVQVMVILPPSLASMYWGGVSVKVGGAARETTKMRDGTTHVHLPVHNSHCNLQDVRTTEMPRGRRVRGRPGVQSPFCWAKCLWSIYHEEAVVLSMKVAR